MANPSTDGQSDFFNKLHDAQGAHARTSDPATSKAAAAMMDRGKMTDLQLRILRAFEVMGDMDDKAVYRTVVQIETNLGLKPSSPSGVRSRRSDLTKPNTERIEELAAMWIETHENLHHPHPLAALSRSYPARVKPALEYARGQLLVEGLRAPLWDTGKTVEVDGRMCTVWGLAR